MTNVEPVFEVAGHRGFVMTRAMAAAHAERLAELGSMMEIEISPETIVLERSRLADRRFHGKFEHSVFLVDGDDRPVALLGAHEEPAGDLCPVPSIIAMVFAVDPALRGAGLARAFGVAAMERALTLGFTELEVPAGTPVTLACNVRDVPERRWLVDFYASLGFTELDTIEFHGDRVVRMERRA